MKIALALIIVLVLFILFIFTRQLWDRPSGAQSVDMMKKFDTIVKKGLSLGEDAKVIELRENFIKVGVRNQNGQKAYMVKQRPNNEFRVIYTSSYDRVYKDILFNHIYPDDYDQNEIVAEFEKEIEARSEKR